MYTEQQERADHHHDHRHSDHPDPPGLHCLTDTEADVNGSRQTPAQRTLTTLITLIEQFHQAFTEAEQSTAPLHFSEEGRETSEQHATNAALIGFLADDLRALPAHGTITRRRIRETLAQHTATATAEYDDWQHIIEAAEAQGQQTIYITGRWMQLTAAKRRYAALHNYVAILAALKAVIG